MISVLGLTLTGLDLAQRIAQGLGEAEWLGREELGGSLAEAVGRLFQARRGLVFVASAGLVVRLIAPLLRDKKTDPAVVVVDHQGRYAVSLLSGHLGGANDLARRVAAILGGQAVITTATDNLSLTGWDLLAQERGWVIENPEVLPPLTLAWLDGSGLAVIDPDGMLGESPPNTAVFKEMGEGPSEISCRVYIGATSGVAGPGTLVLRPRCLSVGLGLHREIGLAELEAAFLATLAQAGLSLLSVARLASLDRRRDAPALAALAEKHNLPLAWFSAGELAQINAPNPSAVVAGRVATPSVCEAAALAGWAKARIIVEKTKWPNLTLAVAKVYP
jgi:cobalt-precorrin 5A hydrolase